MDSSVSPTHGEQEMSVWNGHYECACYHPLFVFNQYGDLERCALRPRSAVTSITACAAKREARKTAPRRLALRMRPAVGVVEWRCSAIVSAA
jgi:DDE family transposase